MFKTAKRLLLVLSFFLATALNTASGITIPHTTDSLQTTDLLNKGKKEFAQGNYSAAIACFDNALKADPSTKEINFLAGLAEYNLKDFKKAKDYFSGEIRVNNTSVKAYIYRARSNKDSFPEALADLDLANKLSDNNPEVILAYADLYYDNEMYTKAFDVYTSLLKLRSNTDDLYYKIGFCKYFLKDKISACEYWKKIDDLDDFEGGSQIEKICNANN